MLGTSLAVQWLRLRAPNAGGADSIPGPGTVKKILLPAAWPSQKKNEKYPRSDNFSEVNFLTIYCIMTYSV